MDKPKVTPKDFFLWFGAMAALYGAVVAFIALIFDYINYAFPSRVSNAYYYANPYDSISYEMASLIVLTPLALLLMRLIRKAQAQDPLRREIWIRRWALYLTLFLAGATFVVDLIVLLNAFLQGEDLTTSFLLKVLTVLLVAALGFMHFLADVWGYWDVQRARANMVNYGVGMLVLVSIVSGFFIIGTPQQMRAQKQDAVRIQDLQNIQWQVVNFWQQKEKLPQSLSDLKDSLQDYPPSTTDPETSAQYEYRATGAMSFELCATFAQEGGSAVNYPISRSVEPAVDSSKGSPISDNWQHAAGHVCFTRTIDPERYPPLKKPI
jgi:hypothetical protein